MWITLICLEMQAHASANAAEFIIAFYAETDDWTRRLLLSSIAEAGSPDFMPLLAENLTSEKEDLRFWAEFGLTKINTREARTALFTIKKRGDEQ